MVLSITWAVSAGLGLIAAALFFRRGLAHKMPITLLYLVVSALEAIALMRAVDHRQYANIYRFCAPIVCLIQGFSLVELFHRITAGYPRFNRAGQTVMGSFVVVGAVASCCSRGFLIGPEWYRNPAMVIERDVMMGLVVVLIGSWAVVRSIGLPSPRAAKVAAAIMTVQVTVGYAIAMLIVAGYRPFWMRVSAPIVTGFLTSVAWCLMPRWQDCITKCRPLDREAMKARNAVARRVIGETI